MAKRHVATGPAGDIHDAPPEPAAAPRASNGQFLGGRQLKTVPEGTTREWVNEGNPFDGPRAEIENVLAAAAEKPEPDPPEVPPTDDPNPDPDANPPEETPVVPPAAAAAGREVQPTYLNAQQRADLARKLDESKRERVKDAEIKRVQDEHTALQAKLNSPRLADRIAALGKTPEELLEDLLLGKGDADDKAVATAAGLNPEVAALRAEIDALKNERKAEKDQFAQQQQQQVVTQAIAKLATTVTKANGYLMIEALKQHHALLQEIEQTYDGASDIAAVTQVVADRVEGKLREMYPDVAAVLAAGGTAAEARAAAPVATKKPAMGARGGTARADAPSDGLPMDPGERHMAVKDMFYPTWKR